MDKLKLSQIRVKLPFNITETTIIDGIDHWIKYGYKVDYDVFLPTKGKNLQRGFVWTIGQKRELIYSILKGVSFGLITAILYTNDSINREDKTYKIIDGKQRLSTILSFYNNEFSILHDGQEYYFRDLDYDASQVFTRLWITGNITYEYQDRRISDDDLIRWFELINFVGTPQDKEHLESLKS